jgi:N-acetylmuramoyl-L-alanine amidase
MNKWKYALGATVAALILAIVILAIPLQMDLLVSKFVSNADILLLDPGHGGVDGGAEGANGVNEKDINLAIAFNIKRLAEADGWTVVMTREEDKGLYPEKNRQSIRSLKTADLLERKRIIEETNPLLAVSIHLNSFKQDPSVRGAQTFYPGANAEQHIIDESKLLAEKIQEKLVEGIADGTDRKALKKTDALIFKNPPVPIVIVECGFLSNREEEKLLTEESYQQKLAECIYRGIMEYTGKQGLEPIPILDNRA